MDLLQRSLSGAVLILIIAVIRVIAVNKLPKRPFLVLWDVALARLLLPVVIPIPAGIYSQTRAHITALDAVGNRLTNFAGEILKNPPDNIEMSAQQVLQGGTSKVPVLLSVWALGAASLSIFFLASWLRCRREFQTSLPIQNDFVSGWLRTHPLRRTIEVRELAGLSTPLTYGAVCPVILVPKDMDWNNQRRARYMLFHEYVHIRHFDTVGKVVVTIALCVHWFNPLAWVMYILFNRDIELACDESVIRHFGGGDRKSYAMTLISMEEQRSGLAPFSSYFGKSAAEERINAIMKTNKISLPALILTTLLVAVVTTAAFTARSKSESVTLNKVLKGETEFLFVSGGTPVALTIENVPALFDPDHAYYTKIWNFTSLDLDRDGENEVVLSVFGAAGDIGGQLILHQIGDQIYGYKTDSRTLTDLKTDGTGSYSDPTGVAEVGICAINGFTTTGYTLKKISYATGTYRGSDNFVVNERPATEREYLSASEEQMSKTDVIWYEFSIENIKESANK